MIDEINSLPAGPEHTRLPSLKTNGQAAQERARHAFLTDSTSAGTSKRKARRAGAARTADADTLELVEFLRTRRQQVVVELAGVSVTFNACAHVDQESNCLSLCTWGDNATSLKLSAEGTEVHVHLEDGRTFHALYLGCQVRLGLHGMLIGLNLVSE